MYNIVKSHFKEEILGIKEKIIYILTALGEKIIFKIIPLNAIHTENLKKFIYECIEFIKENIQNISVVYNNNIFYVENGSKIIIENTAS